MPRRGENIYKRKDGRWEARYVKEITFDGTKKYGSVYGKSYSEVKRKQLTFLQNPNLKAIKTDTKTVCIIMNEWLESIKNRIKHSTFVKYESIIENHISCTIGNIRIDLLTPKAIANFTDEKLHYGNNKTLSTNTVNSILVVLSMGLSYAEAEYGIKTPKIHMLKLFNQKTHSLSDIEQRNLLEYIIKKDDIYCFAVLLALYTGLRIGEICALQWEDIKETKIIINKTMQRIKISPGKTKVVITSPKTPNSDRIVPISSTLLKYISKFRKSTGYVIQQNNGKYVEPRLMQLKFANIISECKIENSHFHILRHTFATRCIESGMDAKTLSEILGHSDVKTTLNRYVHSSFEFKKRSIEKLDFSIST